eukprot:8120921-Pyramimonas_sp.AAC.1
MAGAGGDAGGEDVEQATGGAAAGALWLAPTFAGRHRAVRERAGGPRHLGFATVGAALPGPS